MYAVNISCVCKIQLLESHYTEVGWKIKRELGQWPFGGQVFVNFVDNYKGFMNSDAASFMLDIREILEIRTGSNSRISLIWMCLVI